MAKEEIIKKEWTSEEEEILFKYYTKKLKKISEKLGRDNETVQLKLLELIQLKEAKTKPTRFRRRWDKEEEYKAYKYQKEGFTLKEIANMLGRTVSGVSSRVCFVKWYRDYYGFENFKNEYGKYDPKLKEEGD